MTTSDTLTTAQESIPRFRLPDIPEKHPEDMTTLKHLAQNGNMHNLLQHLGKQETTIVSGDRYMCRAPGSAMRYPDLLVAFNADPALYELHNGYIISEQGKPPDFVLEIASRRTGAVDTGGKARLLRVVGDSGILAVRRDGRISRRSACGRHTGGRALSTCCNRGIGGRHFEGIQRGIGSLSALGSRGSWHFTTLPPARPSHRWKRRERAPTTPKPVSASWKRCCVNKAPTSESRRIETMTFDRITVNPSVCQGKATVRGMRITVEFVLKLLGNGYAIEEILQEYPLLEREDVHQQCAAYGAWLAGERTLTAQQF